MPPTPRSACWCWPRRTRSVSPTAWAPSFSSASRSWRARRSRACARADRMAGSAALVDRYLEHARVEKRLAQRTLELYSLDLQKLCDNAAKANVEVTQVQNAHVRRWVAQ